MRAAALVLLLAGCGTIPVDPGAGRNFTVQHGTARFPDAMQGAKEHCARSGMAAKHLGSDHTGYLLLSRFECVPM